ncbi:MAG: 7TM domain-containing protein [Candidatus Moraniibacteriota bacterium]
MTPHPLIVSLVNLGIPQSTVILLLMLPIIATVVAFFRQIIGIKAFGIYTPSIITFAFLAFEPKGWKYGTLIFITMILIGMLSRYTLRYLRVLYLPRVAITLTFVSFAMLGVLALGGYFQRTGLATVDIFPLLIMITLVEKFVATQIEKGDKIAIILAIETLFISLVGYFIARSFFLNNLILVSPWIVLLTLPINVLLGKWSGLRLTELVRFRHIFTHN